MNKKDRQLHVFLQLFLLITGGYLVGYNIWKLSVGVWPEGIFEFHNRALPVFELSAGLITALMSLIAAILLWMRANWSYAFCLITSGLLVSYTLTELGGVIYTNPYHAIPMVLVLFVVMQTLPFLMRRSTRILS